MILGRHPSYSIRALIFFSSNPEAILTCTELEKKFGISKDNAYTIMQNGRKHGYFERIKIREFGDFGRQRSAYKAGWRILWELGYDVKIPEGEKV